MNENDNNDYNPADDDNQGVVQLMAQGEKAGAGAAQIEYMNPVTASGPEPEKAEVNDQDTEVVGTNDDVLAEEEVENGEVELDNE